MRPVHAWCMCVLALAGCRPTPDEAPRPPRPRSAPARPALAPKAVVHLPAGSFVRGRNGGPRADEAPEHVVEVSPFTIDAALVTRADFARFVEATGYVTSAEHAGVGIGSREGMDDWAWERVPRGTWRRPFRLPDAEYLPDGGPSHDVLARELEAFLQDDAPVVMVSHDDAVAYCAHLGERLPTEAEWEYAMRAGRERSRYPWGDEPTDAKGSYLLNFWQGESHTKNDRLDGFVYVSPVRAFPPNAWGLYDPVGNVWQWTADVYAKDTYRAVAPRVRDPKGPTVGDTFVLRGGSWWCGACTCEGNGLHYRGKAQRLAAFNNNGFRCAK